MLTHIRRVLIIVLPVVVAGLLLAFFALPKEAKTVVVDFEPQAGVDILYTTGFGCANELSLEEFDQAHSAVSLLVDSDLTSNFKLFVVANDSANTCVKAKLVSIDPTVYGQVVEDYEIDADNGLLTIEIGSKWRGGDGIDSAGILNPANLLFLVGVISVGWVLIAWSTQYTRRFWEPKY